MQHLPIFLDVKRKIVVVDGGGTVAARRIERALSAGARVLACDPNPQAEVRQLIDAGHPDLTFCARPAKEQDVAQAVVVYGASEDPLRDANLRSWAEQHKVLCNIADQPQMCDFITPSIVDRSPVVVAISTGGAAPIIARGLRARIETMLGPNFGTLAQFVGGFREQIASTIRNARDRRHFWEQMIDGPAGDLFLAGNRAAAAETIAQDLAEAERSGAVRSGQVSLVGVGPGDPDLLSFKALRLMQCADVVFHDRKIGEAILALVRRDARRIVIDTPPNGSSMTHASATRQMIDLARQGNRVLRLMPGDPFVFGSATQEVTAFAHAKVPFRIVPGLPSAVGACTMAGIPLTDPDCAHSCVFVVAPDDTGEPSLDWHQLVRPLQTVVVDLGASSLQAVVDDALHNEVAPETPVAILDGTAGANPRALSGRLSSIVDLAQSQGFDDSAVLVLGQVVPLRTQIDPLHVVTPEDLHDLSLTADKSTS